MDTLVFMTFNTTVEVSVQVGIYLGRYGGRGLGFRVAMVWLLGIPTDRKSFPQVRCKCLLGSVLLYLPF